MTKKHSSDARPSSLHKRLTVALADAADRARLAEVIAGDLGAVSVESSSPLVRSEDLWQAADVFARDRAEDRRALRSRLDVVAARAMHDCDTARHQLEHLQGWQRTITEGAAWATQLHTNLPEHLAAFEAVRDALDERRAEQRTSQHDLDRVLEQRTAAATAIEEADRELTDMAGSGMDESGLRRELEAAGQAVQHAEATHAAALGKLEELQLEATGLEVRREAAQPSTDRSDDSLEAPEVAAIRAALGDLQAVSIAGEVDADAAALARAWRDLHDDLREVAGPDQGVSELEVDAARRRVAAASAAIAELDAASSASVVTPAERASLDAAHTEVLEAEEQITGRRRGSGAARQRLDAAQAAERALLDQHGFGGYLDMLLSGGRSAAIDPARPAAEREHFEATLALEALERTTKISPELRHLRSERTRLLRLATDLLCVDPGTEVAALLQAHRPGSAASLPPLAEALAAAGIQPTGMSLEAAAIAFLEEHPLPEPVDARVERSPEDRRIELAAIESRSAALEGELAAAQTEVERSAEELQLARRSVDAFEGELTVRAGEDVQRMQRFAAAEQLRAQIESVAGTLRRAEEGARLQLEAADQAVIAAESAFEQTASDISELARRARKLAEELPIDDRPEGDPLHTLPDLAASLDAHAEVLQPEIDKAALAVDNASEHLEEALAACRLAGAGDDGPHPDDLADGLNELLTASTSIELLVLDEPFVGVDDAVRLDLLEIVRTASADRQLVLLTEDAEVLGWAIELPVEEATAVPAEALLTRMRRSNHGLNPAPPGADATATVAEPAAPTDDSASADVDITTTTTIHTDHEAAPTIRRWAGQR